VFDPSFSWNSILGEAGYYATTVAVGIGLGYLNDRLQGIADPMAPDVHGRQG